MSKRLVKRLCLAGKPTNLAFRESIVVEAGIVHRAGVKVAGRSIIPLLPY